MGLKEGYWNIIKNYYSTDSYEIEDAKGYTIPTRFPLTNAVAPGFITAGDAAFHAQPLTAEGHGPALMAGYFAGKTAIKAINNAKIFCLNVKEEI